MSFSIIALVLCIYSYPALKTTAITGVRALPPNFAPDLSLYLNISAIKTTSFGQVVDPFYGVTVPTARMGYLKFRLSFALFGRLNALLGGHLWWSLFLWNLFWWGLLAALALWFFHEFLPDSSPLLACTGLTLLMFFNLGVLQQQLSAWVHALSPRSFDGIGLPYIRSFFPQVPIPLLILYLGLQIRAWQRRTWKVWTAMALTQFFAFAIFPYAMLMMVGVTAISLAAQAFFNRASVPWRTVLVYAVSCALADLIFFVQGSDISRTGAPGQYSLIHLQLSVLPHRMGGMWLLLATLTVLVSLLRRVPPETRWPILGLGMSNLFLMIGDVFFSETALQMSHHAGYFVQLTATILSVTLLSAGFRYLSDRRPLRFFLGLTAAWFVVNGMVIAHASYGYALSANEQQAELAHFLEVDPPQTSDLVIARSLTVDDDCAWVPLIARSHVLFCRNAQVLLSPEQNQRIQRLRQAFYLYFTGKDTQWLEHVLDDRNAVAELTRLAFLGQVTTDSAERQKGVDAVRAELLPLLAKVQAEDAGMRDFFSQYRRIIVIDNVANPYFSSSRVSKYLKIESQKTQRNLLILRCTSLQG